jgi:hypothetical protein
MASDCWPLMLGTIKALLPIRLCLVRHSQGPASLGARRAGERPPLHPVHRTHGQDGCDSRGQVKEREAADNNSPHRNVAAHASEANCLFVIQ